MTSNPYGCPESVYRALLDEATPMLVAIAKLGPARVQWLGSYAVPPTCSGLTAWALDGYWAFERDLLEAV